MNTSRNPHISRNAALAAAAAFGLLAITFQACDVDPPESSHLSQDPLTTTTSAATTITTLTPPATTPVAAPSTAQRLSRESPPTSPAPLAAQAPQAIPAQAPAPQQPATYYANCTAARAAGAAPIHRGKPGYRPALDRDNDGIACE